MGTRLRWQCFGGTENDAYRQILGAHHLAAFGQPLHEIGPEVRELTERLIRRTLAGSTVTFIDTRFPNAQQGATPDAWYDLTVSPLRDPLVEPEPAAQRADPAAHDVPQRGPEQTAATSPKVREESPTLTIHAIARSLGISDISTNDCSRRPRRRS